MRAMFAVDRWILFPFLMLGLAVFYVFGSELSFDEAFVFHPIKLTTQLFFGWIIFGSVFGWTMGTVSRWRGLTDLLQHRERSKSRLLLSQVANCVLVMLVILVLPWVAIAWLSEGLFEPDYLRVGAIRILSSTSMLTSFATCYFLAQLRVPFLLRFLLTGPLLLQVLCVLPDNFNPQVIRAFPLEFGLQNLALIGVLLLCAVLAQKANDPDLPPTSHALLPTLAILLSMGWAMHVQAGPLMAKAIDEIDSTWIATKPDGTFALAVTRPSMDSWEVSPSNHLPTLKNLDLKRVPVAPDTPRPAIRKNGSDTVQVKGMFRVKTRVSLSPLDGTIDHHFLVHGPEESRGVRVRLQRDQKAFSRSTKLVLADPENGALSTWAGDPADGTLWFAHDLYSEPEYRQVPLPDGLRFIEWLQLDSALWYEIDQSRGNPGTAPKHDWNLEMFRTDRGYAMLDPNAQEVFPLGPKELKVIQNFQVEQPPQQVHTTHLTAFSRTRQVQDQGGKVLFSHTYQSEFTGDRVKSATVALLSFAIPPIFDPLAFGNFSHVHEVKAVQYYGKFDEPPKRLFAYLVRLYIHGSRLRPSGFTPGSLPAWAMLLLIAGLARRRLAKFGATGPRLWIWPLAILCFGLVGVLIYFTMESKRSYFPMQKPTPREHPKFRLAS